MRCLGQSQTFKTSFTSKSYKANLSSYKKDSLSKSESAAIIWGLLSYGQWKIRLFFCDTKKYHQTLLLATFFDQAKINKIKSQSDTV